jgi:hypothetical protein
VRIPALVTLREIKSRRSPPFQDLLVQRFHIVTYSGDVRRTANPSLAPPSMNPQWPTMPRMNLAAFCVGNSDVYQYLTLALGNRPGSVAGAKNL